MECNMESKYLRLVRGTMRVNAQGTSGTDERFIQYHRPSLGKVMGPRHAAILAIRVLECRPHFDRRKRIFCYPETVFLTETRELRSIEVGMAMTANVAI